MSEILKTIKTKESGFLEMNRGIKVLHISGEPYERGYQHGFLLAKEISEVIRDGLTGAASVIAMALDCSMDEAFEVLRKGKEAAEGYIPPEFREEMRGIADGIAAEGSNLGYGDVVLWNTMYDQWCFYARPDLTDPSKESIRHAYPPGCSSFSAWGDATVNGRMVFGKNMDNLNIPGAAEHSAVPACKQHAHKGAYDTQIKEFREQAAYEKRVKGSRKSGKPARNDLEKHAQPLHVDSQRTRGVFVYEDHGCRSPQPGIVDEVKEQSREDKEEIDHRQQVINLRDAEKAHRSAQGTRVLNSCLQDE
jgi:hypothetical protein